MRQTLKKLSLTYRSELADRIGWLIRLRWFAASGVLLTILLATSLFDLKVDRLVLLLITSAIFVTNLGYQLYFNYLQSTLDKPGRHRRISQFANLQISLDLLILTVLLYFSGGGENPFFFYYIFHMIIASILLEPADSYRQATLAALFFNSMLFLESQGVLPHHSLFPFFSPVIFYHPLYMLSLSAVFTSTLYFSVYMATSITTRLRSREQELVELKESLELSNRELTDVHEHRSRFILKVEHELKAPLAAIQSLITVILTSFSAELSPKVSELLGRAEKRTHVLLEMIGELLELSRMQIADHSFEKQPLELAQVVKKQLDLLRSQAEEKSLELVLEVPDGLPPLLGNPQAIDHVVMNLISNAVKYTEQGEVRISAGTKGDYLRLEVADTGIGIDSEEAGQVFDEFFRGIKAKQTNEGTGLGLSIVHEIIERHGGWIDLESTPGVGSKFTVLLPLAREGTE